MEKITNAANSLEKVFSVIGRVIGGIAAGLLFALMIFIALSVVLRYIFHSPITGAVELTQFALVIVVFFGLAYCAIMKSNVSVSMVFDRLPPRSQAVIDSLITFIGLGFIILLTWQSALQTKTVLRTGHKSGVLGIPHYPFEFLLTIGCLALCLILVVEFLHSLSRLVKR